MQDPNADTEWNDALRRVGVLPQKKEAEVTEDDIQKMIDWMLNEDFTTAYKNIWDMKSTKGLALSDILSEVHTFVHRIDFPQPVRFTLLHKLAEAEYRLAAGTSEKIQLSGLIAAFQCVRDTVAAEAR